MGKKNTMGLRRMQESRIPVLGRSGEGSPVDLPRLFNYKYMSWGVHHSCYNFTSFFVPLLFSTLTLPVYGCLFISFFSFLITHTQLLMCSMITHMLAHVLTHAQFCLLICLLIYAYSAYSYTVVVQYIRTGWTPLFDS